jgi:FAD/FMN-containing dehydrogenase
MQGSVDGHPALIVRVADSADVAAVIALARETGTTLAVRAGGHSGAGHSTVDGGIVLDVRDLRDLDIDLADRTAWVGAGLTAGDVTRALSPHGLAIGFGDTGSVGVAGITLGGGIGYLARSHGMTIDNLLAAEVVTAAGEVLVADAQTHPDLFWSVRGGAGNTGVVTRFRFRLAEVPEITGGVLVQPATPATIESIMAAGAAAPEALGLIVNVMPCPPLPFVPEAHHGELVLFTLACWSGDPAQADAALAPVRAVAEPLGDMLRPSPYAELFPAGEDDHHPLAVSRNGFLDAVTADKAARIVERLEAFDAPMKVVQLRPLGGAMGRVDPGATAFAHRDRAVMATTAAFYTGPADLAATTAWVEALARDLRDGPGAYVNFLLDEGDERVREAYPGATYERLAQVKRRYDPDNLFRRTQNVPPAA